MQMRIPVLLLCVFLAGCCHATVEDNSGNVATTQSLKSWGLLIVAEVETGNGDFVFSGEIRDVLKRCRLDKRYSDAELSELEHDFWDQPFRKTVDKQGDTKRLRIVSSGANRKLEDGEGDDLVLELVWDGQKDIKGSIRYISSDGTPSFLTIPAAR